MELAMVVVILAIMLGIAMASYKNYMDSLASSGAAQLIANDLEYQRKRAMVSELRAGVRVINPRMYYLFENAVHIVTKRVDLKLLYGGRVTIERLTMSDRFFFEPQAAERITDIWAIASPMDNNRRWGGGSIIEVKASGKFANYVNVSPEGNISISKTRIY